MCIWITQMLTNYVGITNGINDNCSLTVPIKHCTYILPVSAHSKAKESGYLYLAFVED